MKIVISATGENKTDLIDSRFGRCEYFQIFDTDTNAIKSVVNEAQDRDGGAGVAAAQQVIDLGAKVLISWKVGPSAYNLFKKAGIRMYSSECISVENAITAYINSELQEIEEAGPAHHGS